MNESKQSRRVFHLPRVGTTEVLAISSRRQSKSIEEICLEQYLPTCPIYHRTVQDLPRVEDDSKSIKQ